MKINQKLILIICISTTACLIFSFASCYSQEKIDRSVPKNEAKYMAEVSKSDLSFPRKRESSLIDNFLDSRFRGNDIEYINKCT